MGCGRVARLSNSPMPLRYISTRRNPGRQAPLARRGWRATGDLGWVDEDGYVFFAGRKDDMIIRGGENIAPAEIETVLMSHPAVDEAAVIGVASMEWGQTVKAYVVLRGSEQATAQDIQEFCRTRLASFKRPEQLEFIEALPKNALGKILRKELHEKRKHPAKVILRLNAHTLFRTESCIDISFDISSVKVRSNQCL
jgi:acyl-CoA synthetase (AMP-forming)/AMP-acid ligase II